MLVGQAHVATLAFIGMVWLALRRAWTELVALIAIGPAMAMFLLLLAARETYVSPRYSGSIELAVEFAAGIGLAGLVAFATGRLGRGAGRLVPRTGRGQLPGHLAVAGAASVLAVVALMPWGPLDEVLTNRITRVGAIQANIAAALPAIDAALDRMPGSREWPEPTASVKISSNRRPVLLAPGALRPRLAVDLDLPVDVVIGLTASTLDREHGLIGPGQIIVHDRHERLIDASFEFLETGVPFVDRGLLFRPIYVDEARGMWVHEVAAPP